MSIRIPDSTPLPADFRGLGRVFPPVSVVGAVQPGIGTGRAYLGCVKRGGHLATVTRLSTAMVGLLIALGGAGAAGVGTCNQPCRVDGGAPAAPPPGIEVRANRLVDRAGTPILLHGVDMSGTEYACAENAFTDPFGGQPEDNQQTFAAMRSWRVNAVRVPLNEDCWLGINGVRIGGAAYRVPVIRLVRDLEAAGFYVILDLHWSAPGAQRALAQNGAPDEDHSPAFWRSVASTFRTDRSVIFDLFNEPNFSWVAPGGPDQWTCLWHGCVLARVMRGPDPPVMARWRTAGMDQLISVVRATGARNLILVAGVDSANDLSRWQVQRPHDPNLAASWHSYPGQPCATVTCWDRTVAPLAREVPVVITETGDSTAGPETYLPSLLPWADAHHLSYLAWTWNAWSAGANVLVTSMTRGTPTPGEGAEFHAHLLALGGSSMAAASCCPGT